MKSGALLTLAGLTLAISLFACTRFRDGTGLARPQSGTLHSPEALSLAQVTPASNTSTSELERDRNFTYFDMRVGNTPRARREAIEALESVSDPFAKIAYASRYVSALEFQFWKPALETPAHRDRLVTTSLAMVFGQARIWIEASALENLRALGAALHFVNFAQEGSLRALPGTPEMTLNRVLESGLRAKDGIDSGARSFRELSESEKLVSQNESIAVFLLRVRQNALKSLGLSIAMSALGEGSAGKDRSTGDPLLRIFAPDFTARDPSQIGYIARVFEYAKETREFLQSVGYDPKDEDSVQGILSRLDFTEALTNEKNPAKLQSLERLRNALL